MCRSEPRDLLLFYFTTAYNTYDAYAYAYVIKREVSLTVAEKGEALVKRQLEVMFRVMVSPADYCLDIMASDNHMQHACKYPLLSSSRGSSVSPHCTEKGADQGPRGANLKLNFNECCVSFVLAESLLTTLAACFL